jgi:hypothetical protein
MGIDAESWRVMPDDRVADAAKHLSDYTEEGERIIRAELRRRGMADPPTTERPIEESSSPVVNRYRDAYRVGATLVGFGNAIKMAGAILGGIIVIGSLIELNGPVAASGVFLGVAVGLLFWVCGVMAAASGQILRATLDNAVASSHFLTNPERADAMGLPRSVTNRSTA